MREMYGRHHHGRVAYRSCNACRSDLRAEGYPIVTEWVGAKRHARYRLVPDPVQVTLFFADAV